MYLIQRATQVRSKRFFFQVWNNTIGLFFFFSSLEKRSKHATGCGLESFSLYSHLLTVSSLFLKTVHSAQIRVYVPAREQTENLAAKKNQESREIAPWKPSAQHTPKPQNPRQKESSTAAQSHRTAVQQSTPTAKMADTPAALDRALEATMSSPRGCPSVNVSFLFISLLYI